MLAVGILVLDINVVPNHYFLNFFVLSMVEIPSVIVGWLSCQYFGRRFSAIVTYAASVGISAVGLMFVNGEIKESLNTVQGV